MLIYRQEDVQLVNGGVPMSTGVLCIDGQMFKVASGGWDQKKQGLGPILVGLYNVSPAIRLADTPENQTYRGEQFPWYARLTPKFYTSHTGYLIHPKGKWEGTLGCIEVWENELVLFDLLANLKGSNILKVI